MLVNSIASGTANAFLTLRVGIVARQYLEALAVPRRQEARRSATIAALGLVGDIAKENGALVAKSAWNAVKRSVESTVGATVQGVKGVAEKTADTATAGVKAVGGVFDSTVDKVKGIAEKISFRQTKQSILPPPQ